MHRKYRAVPVLLAATILLAGSSMSVSAKGIFNWGSADTTPTYQSGESLITASLDSMLNEDTEEITAEEAKELLEAQEQDEIEALEEAVGSSIEETAVADVSDCVNVRESADSDSEIVGKLYADSIAVVIGSEGEWYQITSGSVEGYVKAEYLIVGDADAIADAEKTIATVTADSLKVREEATTDSDVLTSVTEGDEIEVTADEEDGWVAVTTSAGDGYVCADYVEISTGYETALTIEEIEEAEAAAALAKGSAVVAYASQFVGNPYVYGGTSLTNGADCSGFVMSVYAHFGISLPHSSYAMRSVGVEVDRSDIQPGDIVCYSGHVGIYAGNNTLVHAASTATGIKYTYGIDYRTIITIRRVL